MIDMVGYCFDIGKEGWMVFLELFNNRFGSFVMVGEVLFGEYGVE